MAVAHDETVAVLRVDADLRGAIPASDRDLAERLLLARCRTAEPGPWEPDLSDQEGLGLLVVEGLLTRDLEILGSTSRELLGEGDVVRPWDDDSGFSPVPASASWTVLEPTRFAVLDARFVKALGRWPLFAGEMIHRVMRRSRWLAVRLAIANIKGINDRLMVFLWHLAGIWGRVLPEGTLLPVNLTHELIAELIGARRPSVTKAISELRAEGLLERRPEGWLLRGAPPEESADA